MKVIAVIPAYNEERTIREVIVMVKKNVDQVIVINDGSTDQTAKLAQEAGAEVYSHFLNRGLGAALITGFEAALKQGADIIITFDADGQHRPEDISRLIEPILKDEAEVVIGSRFLEKQPMPLSRRVYNLIANFITHLLFGLWVSDSQSGLRVFKRQALKKIKIQSDRMEVSSEIIREIKRNKLKLKEIPIKPIYTDYSMSKGQNFRVGLKTFFRLILEKIL